MADSEQRSSRDRGGIVAWFAGHHVAANLLMLFILAAGAVTLTSIVVEVFPEFSVDSITIQVPYRGASPAESEDGVVLRVEEAIASIQGIKRISSVASEGVASIRAEVEDGEDSGRVLEDIKAAVDRIDTFPEEIEQPVIAEVLTRRQVISVVLSGDVSLETLASLAERVRDDLTATDAITQADVKGRPPYEISIEISERTLRRHGLTFSQVADVVRQASVDLPGGSVKTEGGEILLRTEGQRYSGGEFEDVVLLTRGDGTEVRLGDLAQVIDGFEDTDVGSRFDGRPAVLVQVYRTGDESTLEVARTVHDYVAEAGSWLPAGVVAGTWQDSSVILRQRIDLLLDNARLGLVLVFICLALFLDLRLAFWTTLGIPISFLGGVWLLPQFDVTVNMISLFAFIVSLGIVVDDAIVVGENVFAYRQRGMKPLSAAIKGAREMARPVTFAILTSVAAFMPLVFVDGTLGKVMRNIPLVVIAVLLMSLLESLLILPAHLTGNGKAPRPLRPLARLLRPLTRLLEKVRGRTTRGLEWVTRKPYHDALEQALEWRYLTLASAVAVLMLTVGVVGSGIVKFTFMPRIDADDMTARLEMPQGTPAERTEAVARRIEAAAMKVGADFDSGSGLESPVILHVATTIGEQPSSGGGGPTSTNAALGSGGHLAEVKVELLGGEKRGIASGELLRRWREEVGEVPGAAALTFNASLFSAGDAISVRLSHRDFESLLAASERLKQTVAEFPGVTDVADSFVPGKRELELDLTAEGRALGVTLQDLARQVRQGFFGEEAQRIQRGRDDIRVMVRYPEAERRSLGDVEAIRIRLDDGTEVPFTTVATATEGRGFAAIDRVDRRRVVTVTADVDDARANANEINQQLRQSVLPGLVADFPGLSFDFEGEQRDQREALGSLGLNFVIAQLVIFALLAIPFRSYSQPLIIMSVIPFGFVGAVAGHLMMGMDLSLLSFFGLVALTGVVVNDSLIMIDLINRERQAGTTLDVAIREAGKRRFRPIILTTLTTFLGLSPMILETSLQARFLIPMALSLGFGIVFATFIMLFLVPVIYRILEDLHLAFGSTTVEDAPEAAAPASLQGAPAAPSPA